MKLQLNLTLRRALIAAMAMVALQTAEAKVTTSNGHLYITGTEPFNATQWTKAWGNNKGVLTVGTSQGTGSMILTNGTYTTPNAIFIGGVGYNTNGATANDGSVTVQKNAVLTAGSQLNVGSSLKTSTGTLNVNGGTVNAGSEFSVGIHNGQGIVDVKNGGSIIVKGNKGAIFRMSYGNVASDSVVDTATFTNSSIIVGTTGGAQDYTVISHSGGAAVLNLTGSTASFADQTIVGEKGGSHGTIHVHNDSELNMTGTTTLGLANGAYGEICAEAGNKKDSGSSITAQILEVGNAGKGVIKLDGSSLKAGYTTLGNAKTGNGTITATGNSTITSTDGIEVGDSGTGLISLTNSALSASNYITVGDEAGSKGTINSTNGTISTKLLTIGDAGNGTVTTTGKLTATELTLGKATTGNGTLNTSGTTSTDKLYVGYQGNGTANVTGGTLSAKEAYIVGTNSALNTTAGTTTLNKATAVAGAITTAAGATTKVTNELILANGGSFSTDGTASIADALINTGSALTVGTTGKLNTTGTVINNGSISVAGTMATTGVQGAGSTTIDNGATLNLSGSTAQNTITNNGTINLSGTITAASLNGTGTSNIIFDAKLPNTAPGQTLITLDNATENDVQVKIDMSNATALVGKSAYFLKEGDVMAGLSKDSISLFNNNTANGEIDWNYDRILLTSGSTNMQLDFTYGSGLVVGSVSGMTFNRLTTAQSYVVEVPELPIDTSISLEVVTETVTATAKTETLAPDVTIDIPASTVLNKGDNIQTTTISLGFDENGNEKPASNVIIGKNVESDTTQGSTNVQSIIANQVTTVTKSDSAGNTTTETKKETVASSGLALVFDGTTSHSCEQGKSKEDAHYGFQEGTVGSVITKDDQNQDVQSDLSKIDVVKLNDDSHVTLENLNMHSSHSMTISNATLVLDGSDLHVGGTVDKNLMETVTVTVPTTNGETITKEVQLESQHHISVDSIATNSTIELKNGAVLDFKVVDYNEDHTLHMGSATLEDTTVLLTESTLGGTKESASETYEYMEIKLVGEKSHVKGTGHVKKVNMKGGQLSVGNSPGVLNVTDSKFDKTKVNFYFITNSDEWNFGGKTTSTTKGSGAISQLNVNKSVTLSNVAINILFENYDSTTNAYTESTGSQIAALGSKFEDGAEVQLITNVENLTEGSSYTSISGLPTLEEGLYWDTTTLFIDGIIRVYGEILEEPVRVANSLLSAGDTVLSFGRMAAGQGQLREEGTTRAWGSAIGNFDSVDSKQQRMGYDYSNWGAAVGFDHAFTKRTLVGASFARSYGENTPDKDNGYYSGGTIDQDASMVGLYGIHKFRTKGMLNDMRLSAFAAYGWFENDSKRNSLRSGNTATAEWDSTAWVLSAALSRDITTDDNVVITPYVGVEYTNASMDDFTEKGKTYDADYTADKDYSNLAVKIGATVSKTFGSFTPYAGVAYIKDVMRDTPEVTASGKRVVSDKACMPGSSALQLNVGATWQLTESWDLNAGYTAEIRDKATQHDVNVGVGYTF